MPAPKHGTYVLEVRTTEEHGEGCAGILLEDIVADIRAREGVESVEVRNG